VHRSELVKRLEQLVDDRPLEGRGEIAHYRRWLANASSGANEIVLANPSDCRRFEARK
jgi:hypothetical protein